MAALVWIVLACIAFGPVGIAAASPLLPGRDAIWVIGGMAGVLALAVLLVQPLLVAGYLPGMSVVQERRWHRWLGSALVAAVVLHVGGLYVYSPDDIMDALVLAAPTPFAIYGVIGMWCVVVTALLVAVRTRLGMHYSAWRVAHNAVAVVVVVTSVLHAVLIEGAMGQWSKLLLCFCIVAMTALVMLKRYTRVMRLLWR